MAWLPELIAPAMRSPREVPRAAARMTGIGRSKLYELIQEGEIEVIKVGGMTLVPVTALETFLEAHRAAK